MRTFARSSAYCGKKFLKVCEMAFNLGEILYGGLFEKKVYEDILEVEQILWGKICVKIVEFMFYQ